MGLNVGLRSFGVTEFKYKGQISNNVEALNSQYQHVDLGQTFKSVHGDLFARPSVKVQKVKGQI